MVPVQMIDTEFLTHDNTIYIFYFHKMAIYFVKKLLLHINTNDGFITELYLFILT